MANIIIKTEDRVNHENAVLRSFGVYNNATSEQKSAAEIIAARTREICEGKNDYRI